MTNTAMPKHIITKKGGMSMNMSKLEKGLNALHKR